VIYDIDGDWQFLNNEESLCVSNALVISMEEAISIDKTLSNVLLNMNAGTSAILNENNIWTISPQ